MDKIKSKMKGLVGKKGASNGGVQKKRKKGGLKEMFSAEKMKGYASKAIDILSDGEPVQAVLNVMKDLWKALLFSNTRTEMAVGLVLFGCVYGYAWTSGLMAATEECMAGKCTPMSILATLVTALAHAWSFAVIIMVAIIIVDKILIALLFRSNDPETISFMPDLSMPMALRIAFGWTLHPRFVVACVIAAILSLMFAAAYSGWMYLRGRVRRDQNVTMARQVYAFNAVAMVGVIGSQVWLDFWWKMQESTRMKL